MKPIIIVGAPRCGTNALRDALSSLAEFTTWPCDELNALWRTSNSHYPTDALPPVLATDPVKQTIRDAFARRQAKTSHATVVEKTCANTLRLPYVMEIFPNARFLEITRDGRDATASAIKRWQAPFELRYSLNKLRWVPRADLTSVIATALANRARIHERPPGASVNTWGPIWPGLAELVATGAGVPVLAANQWVACTESATSFFESNPDAGTGHLRIRYEDLVHYPAQTLATIVRWAGVRCPARHLESAAGTIRTGSVGAWRQDNDVRELIAAQVEPIVAPTNHRVGYQR